MKTSIIKLKNSIKHLESTPIEEIWLNDLDEFLVLWRVFQKLIFKDELKTYTKEIKIVKGKRKPKSIKYF